MSLSEFSLRTGLSQRKAIHLCEKGLIQPAEDRGGRGHHRRFSDENLAEYQLIKVLLDDTGLELRRAASIMGFVRGFFERLRSAYPNAPTEMPRSLTEASGEKPARLLLIDFTDAVLMFSIKNRDEFSPYVRVALGGRLSGPFDFDKKMLGEAVAVLQIDLARLRK